MIQPKFTKANDHDQLIFKQESPFKQPQIRSFVKILTLSL